MNKKILATLTFSFSLSILTACGGGSDGGRSSNKNPAIQEQQAEGSYFAILRPMSNSLSGYLPTGTAEIKIENDSAQIKTLLDDDARVNHMQNIHLGTRCPDESDDKNGDGLIDINESYAVVGDVLIPLDSDINSAAEGAGLYPLGGGFTYTESASLSKIESDAKARTGQNLNFGGRVVLIHGVAGGTKMPATVASPEGVLMQASVPIACGILKRVE